MASGLMRIEAGRHAGRTRPIFPPPSRVDVEVDLFKIPRKTVHASNDRFSEFAQWRERLGKERAGDRMMAPQSVDLFAEPPDIML